MDLLIAFVVIAIAFMLFGSLVFGTARFFSKRKSGLGDFDDSRSKGLTVRINKSHNIYSFK